MTFSFRKSSLKRSQRSAAVIVVGGVDHNTLYTVSTHEPLRFRLHPPLEDDLNYENGFCCDQCGKEYNPRPFYHHATGDCCVSCAGQLFKEAKQRNSNNNIQQNSTSSSRDERNNQKTEIGVGERNFWSLIKKEESKALSVDYREEEKKKIATRDHGIESGRQFVQALCFPRSIEDITNGIVIGYTVIPLPSLHSPLQSSACQASSLGCYGLLLKNGDNLVATVRLTRGKEEGEVKSAKHSAAQNQNKKNKIEFGSRCWVIRKGHQAVKAEHWEALQNAATSSSSGLDDNKKRKTKKSQSMQKGTRSDAEVGVLLFDGGEMKERYPFFLEFLQDTLTLTQGGEEILGASASCCWLSTPGLHYPQASSSSFDFQVPVFLMSTSFNTQSNEDEREDKSGGEDSCASSSHFSLKIEQRRRKRREKMMTKKNKIKSSNEQEGMEDTSYPRCALFLSNGAVQILDYHLGVEIIASSSPLQKNNKEGSSSKAPHSSDAIIASSSCCTFYWQSRWIKDLTQNGISMALRAMMREVLDWATRYAESMSS